MRLMFLSPHLLSMNILGMMIDTVHCLCHLVLQPNVAGIYVCVRRQVAAAPLLGEWPKDICHEYIFMPKK